MDAAAWDERYRATDRLWSESPNVFVESRLSGRIPGVGLDLASGEGRNAIWLAGQGWGMTAVDFSAAAIERGRQHSDAVDFVVADVLTWEPNRRFDLVLIAYLQLVEADFEPLIRRAATWLETGGELFMVGHDRTNIEHGVGGPQVAEVLWEVDDVVSWLDGLEIVEASVLERKVDGEAVRARDALIRARAG